MAKGVVIPFRYNPITAPWPVVWVRVNDAEALPFLIDTGTNVPLSIDQWAVDKIKLPPPDPATATLTDGVRQTLTALNKIVFVGPPGGKDVQYNLTYAWIGDFGLNKLVADGKPLAGIIGAGLFDKDTIRFDFAAQTLTVFWDPHAPLRVPGAANLPMSRAAEGSRYFVSVSPVPGKDVKLLIDTGSETTQFPLPNLRQLRPLASAPVHILTAKGRVHTGSTYLLPHLSLGNLREPQVAVADLGPGNDKRVLGMNVLSRFRVTLDFRNRQMTLERAADYQERLRQRGNSGIQIRRVGEQQVVVEVREGSPAEKAGLLAGDTLVSVDGQPLAGLPAQYARRLLDGLAGTTATLSLRRGGTLERTVTFVCPSEFESPE